MSLINLRDKTINAKVVYYGTALSGKTTSLKYVHRVIDVERRIELVSLNTEGDRTLFFDFLPIPLGAIAGCHFKLQAFTVPGQVKYNLTRRYVLRGADAVIFVADSRPDAFDDNVRSLASLKENLDANGIAPESLPLVIQYNKRDAAGALAVARLRGALNKRRVPDFATTATTGEGVFEAFTELVSAMLAKLAREYRIGDPAEASRVLRERLAGLAVSAKERPAAASSKSAEPSTDAIWAAAELVQATSNAAERTDSIIEVAPVGDDSDVPDVEKLLERAVDTHIASAQLVTELSEVKHRLADHVRQLAALHEMGVAVASELNGDRLLQRIVDSVLRTVGAAAGSVLLISPDGGSLVERTVRGATRDPIARAGRTDPSLLDRVLARRPFHVDVPASGKSAPQVALVAPLAHQGEVLGALVAYVATRTAEQDLQMRLHFLSAVASQAAVALENSRLFARVESLNRDLEKKVAERTSELESAYRALKALDGMKDDFLSSVSHELLTPLTSITSFAEILSGVAGDGAPASAAERAEFAGVIKREAGRLTDMVQTLLDLNRIEAGKVTMQPSAVDVSEALLASYKRLRSQFKERNVAVKVLADPSMPSLKADPRWMARVFDALLGNAAKFAPEGTEVRVAVREKQGLARVDVKDKGPGVPEALRTAIFERFKQAGNVMTDKPSGLGLGLPMARAILERQGGRIWYEPAKDGGAVFSFTMPIVVASPLAS
jgi:signal transduction histidine kinase/signal recognition particle receptor subunit beta